MERPIERRAFLGVVPGLLALAARPARGQDAPPGVWCGAVTASGATVTVLADGAGVPVELELTDGASPPVRRAQPTDAHGVGHVRAGRVARAHPLPLRRHHARAARSRGALPHLRGGTVLLPRRVRFVRGDRLDEPRVRRHARAGARPLRPHGRPPLRGHRPQRPRPLPAGLPRGPRLGQPVRPLPLRSRRLHVGRPRLRPQRLGPHLAQPHRRARGVPAVRPPLPSGLRPGARPSTSRSGSAASCS